MMYQIKMLDVGRIEVNGEVATYPVSSIEMSRSQFLELVEKELDRFPSLRQELLPVAEEMPRFPMGTWVDEQRGCGCVVGEYLIATAEIGRYNFIVETMERYGDELNPSVYEMVQDREDGEDLIRFGTGIDTRITEHIRTVGLVNAHGKEIDLEAREGIDDIVNSVEIVA